MDTWLGDVVTLVMSWIVGVGPVAVLIGLLNRRDRRQAMLLGNVCGQFSSEALRSQIAIDVRCALLSRRGVVRVDMRGFSRDEVWQAIARLRHTLPSDIRLVVDGSVDQRGPARITVDVVSAEPLTEARA